MRGLLNIVLLVGLVSVVALTWDKSLRERIGNIPVIGRYLPSTSADSSQAPHVLRAATRAQGQPASPQSNGAWMWDPNHHTALDRPAYDQTHTFTKHFYYVDNNGAKYWIDAQGQRHYEP